LSAVGIDECKLDRLDGNDRINKDGIFVKLLSTKDAAQTSM